MIGVVIRTLNESALIGRCLEMLDEQRGGFDLDVLVVDSGSTDATREIARDHGARVVELPPTQFDYSKALNLGIEEVSGELIVILSAHAIPVDAHMLEKLVAPFGTPSVAGVAARQVPWPDAPWQEVHRLRHQFGTTQQEYALDDNGDIVFSNACSCIRRSVWAAEPFTLPAVEDLEWAERVVAAGWKIVYEPEATVYHSHDEGPRAQAQRLIDMNRVADGGTRRRMARRTAREAAGLIVRDSRTVLSLDEPLRRKPGYVVDVLRVAWFYLLDFSRGGTTAERRRDSSYNGSSRGASS
jgi:glycosyltransferase involved in cell wall biosynthesis